jgi:hypothetical protein
MSAKRIRHDKNHWQKLVERQAHSGLSGAQFCRQQNIAYASFMSWRKRLQHVPHPSSAPESTFVELSAPVQIPEMPQSDIASEPSLCVELSLGAGIELRISRRA